MQGRLWIVFGLICVLFVVLIARLMYIQYTSGERYEKIVLSQQEYDSTIIPFQRGNITDAKGTVLATSIDVYNVILDCSVLTAKSDKIDSTIALVCTCFPEISAEDMRAKITDQPDSRYIKLAKRVSFEEKDNFETLANSEEYDDKISGIWFEKEYIRSYPYGQLAAAMIGFSTSGNLGVIGLENQYDSYLNGINGRSYGYLNDDSNMEQTVIEPENGYTLVTSIDVNIQSIVEQEILNWNNTCLDEEHSIGSQHTAVLVMNPQNGEILAMATYPFFDLNNPRDLVASGLYKQEEVDAMTEDEKLEKLNQLWQNYGVTTTYEPGSTFKPFTIAMGLETGTLHDGDTFFCDGGETVSGHFVRCTGITKGGHGEETIQKALEDSCNDALMQMSFRIGGDNFAKFQHIFGFGQKTNVDLPGEARTDSLLYDAEALNQTAINLATNAFGQNFNTTMVQLGAAYCSLINGGNLYQPHVVTAITDSAGNTVQSVDPVIEKKTISKEVSNQLKGFMLGVVEEGTGKSAKIEGYDIGGKTGTAEKLPRGTGDYLVSFISYAPQDNPQVMIYTIVDTANVEDQEHCQGPKEITRNIYSQILPYLGVEKKAVEPTE
ncbi:MAG: penicillin-binding protein 2 [Lachnospiraceae bacterium]|nr:penicillin-binding protein 2 [Lachnospiraceae bacterium]